MTELVQSKSLNEIRQSIITSHEEFIASMHDSMKAAIKAGEQLLLAKQETEYGKFQKWIEENLPFSLRTAQNYMKVAKKQDVIEEKGAKMLSAAYDAVKDIKRNNAYHGKYKEYEDTIDDEDFINKEPTKEEEQWDYDILHPEGFDLPEADLSYIPVLLKASQALRWAYRQLANKRDSTTPKAFGFLVGNLIEMVERIETWKPENMEPCPDCEGTGVTAVYNSYAELENIVCPNCINGKVGSYKHSKR